MRLNTTAKETLRAHGVTQAQWFRAFGDRGRWYGDACGCFDDRCIGYHHDSADDCGCLPALLTDPWYQDRIAKAAKP